MSNSTTNTYAMKRDILTFSNKISKNLSKPNKKFTADMTYGILASGSCLLSDITDQLHETIHKVNSIERLSKHLAKGVPDVAPSSYHETISNWVPDEPVIHIDDSDITKPSGQKFEALDRVRDGSKNSYTKNLYDKGYHVTEACVMSDTHHPVSVFSRIHSAKEKDYISANAITFDAIDQGISLFPHATYVMD